MRWTRENELDILCIQEHNAGHAKGKEWIRIARANGYCLKIGTRGEVSTRGGAAILARMTTFDLSEKDAGRCKELEGGMASIICKWQGHTTKFVSLYVPSQADDRKLYLTRLKRAGSISKNSIVLGDFNCVENTTLDVLYQEDNGSKYANHHAGLLMHVMSKAWRRTARRGSGTTGGNKRSNTHTK